MYIVFCKFLLFTTSPTVFRSDITPPARLTNSSDTLVQRATVETFTQVDISVVEMSTSPDHSEVIRDFSIIIQPNIDIVTESSHNAMQTEISRGVNLYPCETETQTDQVERHSVSVGRDFLGIKERDTQTDPKPKILSLAIQTEPDVVLNNISPKIKAEPDSSKKSLAVNGNSTTKKSKKPTEVVQIPS